MMLKTAGLRKNSALQATVAVLVVLGTSLTVDGGLIIGRIRRHITSAHDHRADRILYCSYDSAIETQTQLATQRLEGYAQLRFPYEVIDWDLFDVEVAAIRNELGDPTLTPLERISLLYTVADGVLTEKLNEDPALLPTDVARNRTRMLAAMDELLTTMNDTIRLYRSRAEENCHCSDVISGILDHLKQVRLETSPVGLTAEGKILKYIRVLYQVIRLVNMERRRHMDPHCRSL
ncbi:PREDICTED: uncharacterized protein LOC109465334 [Branchiostoma belcheri]|uniref:Uncharacterized protein LOC109465334 n=1 Tax=Branchiostoma belcheri TaxID=7741 RepID=A0A6P4Y6V8_BRABE|nr:PREDICTED: uncharacterized protein LOC109465334 [Branchiostoma belcheri]